MVSVVEKVPVLDTPRRWRWSVEAFLSASEQGVFGSGRLELLHGEVVAMPPPSPEHSGVINPAADLLRAIFGDGFVVRTEQPLRLDEDTLVLPDLLVCRGTYADYRRRYPTADDVVLAVEVSVSTLDYDRMEKLALYAAAGIAEYWILNLKDSQLEVHRQPHGSQYLLRQILLPTESVTALQAEQSLSVQELLG